MFNGLMLKTLRAAKGWTQADLAVMAGVNRRQLSFYETGKAVPGAEAAYRLATVLGVPMESFFA